MIQGIDSKSKEFDFEQPERGTKSKPALKYPKEQAASLIKQTKIFHRAAHWKMNA